MNSQWGFVERDVAWERCVARFKARLVIDDATGCHLWTGGLNTRGYGSLTVDGVRWMAHRFAWYIAHNAVIDPDKLICHRCDVKRCCNPLHLFQGTHLDNNQDRDAKGRGRWLKGTERADAKLTEDTARAIFVDPRSATAIAAQYGCCRRTVWEVKNRRTWAHATKDLPPAARAIGLPR